MDTLCGVGLPELIIVILIGFVVIGPERSRALALQLGRWLSKAMRSPWWREFNQVTQSLRDLPNTLVRMAELEEAQADIRRTLEELDHETRIDLNERQAAAQARTREVHSGQAAELDPWGIRSSSSRTSPRKPEPALPDEDEPPPPRRPHMPPTDTATGEDG